MVESAALESPANASPIEAPATPPTTAAVTTIANVRLMGLSSGRVDRSGRWSPSRRASGIARSGDDPACVRSPAQECTLVSPVVRSADG